jgi:hypothetical protein
MPDALHHAARVREEIKHFPVSHGDLCRLLASRGRADIRTEHRVEVNGRVEWIDLRLNIACTTPAVRAWAAALKIDRFRVDGVDHHEVYDASDGSRAKGWHRHGWDPSREGTERIPIANFDDVADVPTFVRRVCETLRISLERHDLGLLDDL